MTSSSPRSAASLVAAYAPSSSQAIADPFRRTADVGRPAPACAPSRLAPARASKRPRGLFALRAAWREHRGRRPPLLRGAGRAARAARLERPSAIIYVVWGSTYLAIRVMVETIPPLLGAGAALRDRRRPDGRRARRPARCAQSARPAAELAGAALIGLLLPGANAVVTVAEVDVPSALAALLIASVPLILIVLRRRHRRPPSRARATPASWSASRGVALLLLAGRAAGRRDAGRDAAVRRRRGDVGDAARSRQPHRPPRRQPRRRRAWQMLLGGADHHRSRASARASRVGHVSTDSVLAFAYLVVIGSMIAYTAYAWLLRNVPVSKVATYAYVNPAVAIAARLADPRRDDHRADADRRGDHHRVRGARGARRGAAAATR